MSSVADNFASVRARIRAACAKAGRTEAHVTLVAVSKLHPHSAIEAGHALGQRHFGENYAQELRDKHAGLSTLEGLVWHAIGPVQAKNAKYVAKAATWFHALERLDVAQELSRRRTGSALKVLIEVNVAGEASKAGVSPDEARALADQVRGLERLELVGLTTLPPLEADPRPHFAALRELSESLGLKELSMGTTGDFEAAISEGATLVRVGTALFGNRLP